MRLLLSAALALALAGPLAAGEPPRSEWGHLVIIGGNMSADNDAIYEAIWNTRLAGKPVGVIPTAGGAGSTSPLVTDFNGRYGAGSASLIPIYTRADGDNATFAAQLAACGAFYFTGGDQTRIRDAFFRADGTSTAALDAVWNVYRSGGCIAGSSAGAAIMSDPMLNGGTSTSALANGARPGDSGTGVLYTRGLGFLPGILADQHHLVRGRLGRMVVACADLDIRFGIGIDENTALFVDNATNTGEILGEMGAFVVDAGGAWKDASNRRGGMMLSYMDVGDRIDLATGNITPSANKTSAVPALAPATISISNIWSTDSFNAWTLATTLVNTRDTVLGRGRDGTYDLLLQKCGDTKAWVGPAHTYGNTRRAWTITGLQLSVVRAGEPFPPSEALIIR